MKILRCILGGTNVDVPIQPMAIDSQSQCFRLIVEICDPLLSDGVGMIFKFETTPSKR